MTKGNAQDYEATFNRIAGPAIDIKTDGGPGVRLGRMDRFQVIKEKRLKSLIENNCL